MAKQKRRKKPFKLTDKDKLLIWAGWRAYGFVR